LWPGRVQLFAASHCNLQPIFIYRICIINFETALNFAKFESRKKMTEFDQVSQNPCPENSNDNNYHSAEEKSSSRRRGSFLGFISRDCLSKNGAEPGSQPNFGYVQIILSRNYSEFSDPTCDVSRPKIMPVLNSQKSDQSLLVPDKVPSATKFSFRRIFMRPIKSVASMTNFSNINNCSPTTPVVPLKFGSDLHHSRTSFGSVVRSKLHSSFPNLYAVNGATSSGFHPLLKKENSSMQLNRLKKQQMEAENTRVWNLNLFMCPKVETLRFFENANSEGAGCGCNRPKDRNRRHR